MEFTTQNQTIQMASFDETGSIKNLKELKVGNGSRAWINNEGHFLFGDETNNQYIKYDGSVLNVRGTFAVGDISGLGDLATLDTVSTSELDTTIISGGKVVTGLLTADNIQAGTLTGRTIRTAAPAAGVGNSVVITGGNNQNVNFYYDASHRGYIGGYTTEGSEVTYIQIVAASGRYIKLKNSYTEFDGALATQKIYPRDDNEYELGDSAKRWSKGHFEDIDVDDLTVKSGCSGCAYNELNLLQENEKNSLLGQPKGEKKNPTGFEEGDVLAWKFGRLMKAKKDMCNCVVAVASKNGLPTVLGAEPVKVIGKVQQGDFLVTSTTEGHARAEKYPKIGTVIAQALESKKTEGEGLIKAMIRKL